MTPCLSHTQTDVPFVLHRARVAHRSPPEARPWRWKGPKHPAGKPAEATGAEDAAVTPGGRRR